MRAAVSFVRDSEARRFVGLDRRCGKTGNWNLTDPLRLKKVSVSVHTVFCSVSRFYFLFFYLFIYLFIFFFLLFFRSCHNEDSPSLTISLSRSVSLVPLTSIGR
ncbi:hypothetical protein ANTQUA_LOCUS7904 [Anthophora quadrimaculata]